jgi:hypothetical protein
MTTSVTGRRSTRYLNGTAKGSETSAGVTLDVLTLIDGLLIMTAAPQASIGIPSRTMIDVFPTSKTSVHLVW